MSKRSELTESTKKEVAGIQYYKCANTPTSKLDKLENYKCPLWNCEVNKGSFDKSGYAIDHIIEYSLTKNNDVTNLQALCPSCHAVKTKKFMQVKNKKINDDIDDKKYDSSHDSLQDPSRDPNCIDTQFVMNKFICNDCKIDQKTQQQFNRHCESDVGCL